MIYFIYYAGLHIYCSYCNYFNFKGLDWILSNERTDVQILLQHVN